MARTAYEKLYSSTCIVSGLVCLVKVLETEGSNTLKATIIGVGAVEMIALSLGTRESRYKLRGHPKMTRSSKQYYSSSS